MKNQKSIQIPLSNGVFNCRVLGSGKKVLLAFHGFGQDGDAFRCLLDYAPEFTIYSFDLPFHGITKIHDQNSYLTDKDVQELVQLLLTKIGAEQFSIIAFSIGAKFAFSIIDVFAPNLEDIWLLAPEGIKNSFWYDLATGSKITRRVFKKTMKRPNVIAGSVNLLKSMGLLSRSVAALVKKSINTAHKRDQVVNTWIFLKNLKWNSDRIAKFSLKNSIQIIIGEQDKIISRRNIEKQCSESENMNLLIVEGAHHNLICRFVKQVMVQASS